MGFIIKKIVVHRKPTPVREGEVHYNMDRTSWDVRNLLEVFSREFTHKVSKSDHPSGPLHAVWFIRDTENFDTVQLCTHGLMVCKSKDKNTATTLMVTTVQCSGNLISPLKTIPDVMHNWDEISRTYAKSTKSYDNIGTLF